MLVYTCGDGGTICIHKPNASDLSIHNQHTERGCPLSFACKVKFKAAIAGSNSSYLKSPWLLLKNRKSCLLIFFNVFLPGVCCITAKPRGFRSVWAQCKLITMSLKKWPKPLEAFLHAVVIKTHRLLPDTNGNKGKPGVPEPAALASVGEQPAPQQQQQQQWRGKKPSFITSDN